MMKKIALMLTLMMTGHFIASSAFAEDKCALCHERSTPAVYLYWKHSVHGKIGVGCLDCHEADSKAIDAFEHNGATVSALVTSEICGNCHSRIHEKTSK
jgi:formate-dependent nitrite reductase cytochrome c552 subunit